MVSLQEQLMKAGLVDKKKVKVANQEKSKQQKIERRTGVTSVNESREAALEAQRQQAERARALNAERDAAAAQKAVQAQIAQMVQVNRQSKGKGDIAYNFTIGTKVERIHVSEAVRGHLVAGRLSIVELNGAFELVPRVIAEKIAERAPERVVRVNKVEAVAGEDDPYKDFKIPDDFDW
ncbi:DUF2058 domain-containing protein [Massilia sp. TN1-12]|uniref:DUF2058 domain-containing protein n=1 Tax=Massilia paldalensis TaxID=3377675 RepID=UPI00385060C3